MAAGRRVARVACPAKVNRFLAVGPPDRRGWHPLRTVFQTVGLFDDLEIEEVASGGGVEVVGADLPADNTVTKTLRLVRELVELPPLAVRLTKRIPAESGLGGGSSDAAGVLRGLAALGYAPPWDQTESIAAAVGADVPFFLVGGLARAEGYGEVLTPLPDPPVQHLVIVRPDVGVATPEAYRALDAHPDRPWRGFPADPLGEPFNDFDRVAPCACGEAIERLWLYGATAAMMSGSGSAVFGAFDEADAAAAAGMRALAEGLGRAWVVPTLGRAASLRVEVGSA